MKFKEWFDKNLVVGAFPIMNNPQFDPKEWDYCINVSDEHYFNIEEIINEKGCKTYWFPMNECRKDNGVNSIYGAMIILYYAEQNNKRVYLHCHAGIHRSQLVRCCYYFLRTGHQLDNNWSSFINQLLADCTRGYLPPKSEMEDLLSHLGQKIKDLKFNLDLSNKLLIVSDFGGLLDDCKIHAVRNF